MSGGLDDADEVLALSRICRSPALAVSFIISPPRRRVGNVICLGAALFAPRLASRALSVLNNNQGMRSRRARLLARVAAPNRSHTLAWHASDRGPRFSLSRAGELGSSLHRQREERPCERFMASRRGSRHVYADRPESHFGLHAISNTQKRS